MKNCKRMKLTGELNKLMNRQRCDKMKDIKGMVFSIKLVKNECPLTTLCKYYQEV